MRIKYASLTQALESHIAPVGRGLSLEAEELLAAEAPAEAEAANAELDAAQRTLDVSEALEDLAVIADEIEEATPVETALIENSAQMAVAGSDIQPAELIPAIESYVGKKISTESITDRAAGVYKSIEGMLKSIWEHIEAFLYKIFGNVPNLRRDFEDLAKALEDATGKSQANPNFKIAASISALCVGDKPVSNARELEDAFGKLASATGWVLGDYVAAVSKLGKEIANVVEKVNPDEGLEKTATDAVSEVANAFENTIKIPNGKPAKGMPGWDRYENTVGEQLLGGISLASHVITKPTGSGLSDMEVARRCCVDTQKFTAKKLPSEIVFTTPEITQLKSLVEAVNKLLADVEAFDRGHGKKDMKAVREEMKAACVKAAAAVDASSVADKGATEQYFRGFSNFSLSYARWSQDPIMPMMSTAFMACRVVKMVVAESLKQYK